MATGKYRYLVEFARLLFFWLFWGCVIFCLAFAVFCLCFSGGRDNFLLGLWEFRFVGVWVWLSPFEKKIVELVALTFLFRVGLAQFFVAVGLDFRGILLGHWGFAVFFVGTVVTRQILLSSRA